MQSELQFPHLAQYRVSHLKHGEFYYYPGFISNPQEIFDELIRYVEFEQGYVKMLGQIRPERRQSQMFGEDGVGYEYAGRKIQSVPFPQCLIAVKSWLEVTTGYRFVSCLANYYGDGTAGIGWHSDKEKVLLPDAPIASVSLGCPRFFDLRPGGHRGKLDGSIDCTLPWQPPIAIERRNKPNPTPKKLRMELAPGSLLIMGRGSQGYYQHHVPKQETLVWKPPKGVEMAPPKGEEQKYARINLTFRVLRNYN